MTDFRELMSQTKFYESYARFNEDVGRYETWHEAVERVMDMHRYKYKDKLTEELEELIKFSEDAYKDQLILGAQRALQFGGEQLLKHQIKLYNCLGVETRFVTSSGVKSFKDFKDGDEVVVLTHKGNWKPAVVKNYGKEVLFNITFAKNNTTKKVRATKDHRWLLHNGSLTTTLKPGDRLLKEPKVFEQFEWDTATPLEKLYWCYGMVYGDGTVSGEHSLIRLCSKDSRFFSRFNELGFKTSTSLSLNGDFFAYTGTYKKELPDPNIDSPNMIRAFVAGYLQADGVKNNNSGGKSYQGIQATGGKSIDFIKSVFPIAGVHIISEKDLTGQETNFGVRPKTSRFNTCDSSGSKYNSGWVVKDITEDSTDDVWCLEVEDDRSFIIDGGIVTGNCVSSYADRAKFFGEFMYMLLCGAGAGFSVQRHHVARLPNIKPRSKRTLTYTVEDSIEGWANSINMLMSSYFESDAVHPEAQGKHIHFDLTQIRPKGSKISGGFLAPGPEPLRSSLDKIERLLEGVVRGGDRLEPIHVYDICMFAADAVISGGK